MIEAATTSDQSSVPTAAPGPVGAADGPADGLAGHGAEHGVEGRAASGAACGAADATSRPMPVPGAKAGRIVTWSLLVVIIGSSAALGWFAGRHDARGELVLIEASFAGDDAIASQGGDAASGIEPSITASDKEVGRLKGEMMRLRVLFQRLAEAAELDDDGEFDIDFEIDTLTGSGEPLSALDPADPDALSLLIERFDPMVNQSERMDTIFRERRQEFDRRLSGRPLVGGQLSSGFGHRIDPLTGQRVVHRGLDFVGQVGDPVLALADGVVTFSGPNGGYGLLVELEHAGGFKTRYAHNDSNVAELGAVVAKGETIATLGSSGRSTGPHLHLEVRERGKALDPRYYVR